MEEDEEFLPMFHPLRTYLKSIELDDIDVPVKSSIQSQFDTDVFTYLFQKLDFTWVFDLFHSKLKQKKLITLEHILQSDLLVEDDHLIVEHYSQCICPINREPSAVSFLHLSIIIVIFVFLLVNFPRCFFLLFVPAIPFILYLICLHLSTTLIANILSRLRNLHNSIRRSILFLQGIACSERGITFAASKHKSSSLNSRCFPVYTKLLQKSITKYITAIGPISTQNCKDCQNTRFIDFGGCLGEVSSEMVNSVAAESTLANTKVSPMSFTIYVKAIFEFSIFLDSELLRRIGCLNSLSNSFKLFWQMHKLLFAWLYNLRIVAVSINQLDALREQLIMGANKSTEFDIVTSSSSMKDESGYSKLKGFILNLDSLQYHLITWTNRVQQLKETTSSLDKDDIYNDVSEDLSIMRFFLQNCQICLDEAEKCCKPVPAAPLLDAFNEDDPSADLIESAKSRTLIQLTADDPIIEDEILEAIAGDSSAITVGSVLEDELDLEILDRKARKERSLTRKHLLTELNSVIAHRLMETREREMKALLRARGATETADPEPADTHNIPAKERTAAVRDSVIGRAKCVANELTTSRMRKRVNLRGQHFTLLTKHPEQGHLESDLEPIPLDLVVHRDVFIEQTQSKNKSEAACLPPHEPPLLPPFTADLAGFLRTRKHQLEETFEEVGTGDDLDDEGNDAMIILKDSITQL